MNNDNKENTLFLAEKLLHYNNLLIKQCEKWLSAEEGYKNMEKQILEREKKKRYEPFEKDIQMKNQVKKIL